MDIKNFLKKLTNNNYIFSVITKISLILMSIVISSLQIRFLGKDLDGELKYITSNTTILNTIFVFGIHQAYAYFRKREIETFKSYYLGATIVLFLFYLLVSGGFVLVVRPTFDTVVIVLTIPILFLIKIVRYIVLIEAPKTKNSVEIVTSVAKTLFLLIAFLFFNSSVIWIIILLLFEEITALVMYLIHLKIKPVINKETFKVLAKVMGFGVFPMINLLLNTLNYRVDVLMIKGFDDDFSRVSIYSTGVALAEQCWTIPDAIRDILVSKLANGKKKDEVCKIIRFSNTFTIIAQIGLIALGMVVIIILYGPQYKESYYIMCIAMFGSYGMIYTKMISAYNVVEGRQKINSLFMFIVVVGNIVANAILIPYIGIYGAAIASVISYNIGGIVLSVYFCKVSGLKFKNMILIGKEDIESLKQLRKAK